MWTFNITEKKRESGEAVVVVLFSDDATGESQVRPYRVSGTGDLLELLKLRIKSDLDSLNASYTFAGNAPTGTIDLTPSVPVLTPAQQARKDWLDDVSTLRQMDKAIVLGIMTGAETQYINTKNRVKTNFRAEYLALL